ncbi:T9SS type A sorting domain-containing protein [Psychroserpens sp.]|uniref:T9SS type A sorting domain-containing protein n=1 Tax=Psychroserpens sp. TaxID=2020870 RepID=UPI001B1D005D|nr:T9SS type A sorting domain-containing protein [Psychroserpens sp.]MBO6607210.1 T9SS type A sorting domain-containing protein [Psychroserpens sp.]MBO6654356.1 T9SS type A sorting domain-containing protein [Psychroserpens sp.]MBO6682358.1 T9SS type A sorting domain-containing protein [Psychroserpens sp.]MBO6750982.1 T9SS type A sorting domain-containing protein [Psychroserpens sp.]MBO6915589.1 T9SS type A sorting domain-containing protein [Psychroserpens sp.]
MKQTTMIKQLCLFFALFLTITNVLAQQIEECGTTLTPESERYLQELQPQIKQYEQEFYALQAQRNSSTAVTSVPVKAHVLRTDAGTGGLTESQINSAFAIMNGYYANANLEFFLCEGINFINNSTFYNFTTSEEADLRAAYNVDNVINIYFANEVTNSNNQGLCGYAYFPGGPEVILMNNNCAMNGSTLSHEMGHFLGLSHTHGNSNTNLTNELVDGSNCESAGDFICDTPADPQLSGSNVTAACNYIGVEFDANGDQFQPNPLNIMSYSRKSCRTEFSTGQYARVYAVYQASRASMACPSFNIDIASSFTRDCTSTLDVAFTDNSVGATTWEWDVDGDDVIDYTTQNPNHTYTSTGTYDVALTITNGSESLTKVYQEYIQVGGEDISTSEIVLTLITDDWPAETSWTFSDSSGNILYSSPTYVEGTDDFQTFTENFTVATNECYTFEIVDSYGDGICCLSGIGSYTLETLEGDVIATGGDYAGGESIYMSNDVLGVDDYFTNNSISVYPNPTKDILTIGLSNQNNLPDTYKIYNVLGQEIATKQISTTNDMIIDATKFANGVYYIKIEKGSQATTIPFIKQ